MAPQEYCDKMAYRWKEFCEQFRISYNNFYRTSDTEHKKRALSYFKSLRGNDIYWAKYTELYCKGCESFKSDKELDNGKCPDHPSIVLENVTEENYFFRLSKYAKTAVPANILLDSTLQEELNQLINNAKDMSVSRDKEKVSWAIEIPGTNQTIYCWCEALANYVFAAGYNQIKVAFSSEQVLSAYESQLKFEKWWSNSMIVCGRDNLRFQALILPALLAAKWLPPPTKVFVHGIIQDEHGKKMSKSEGNVIDPIEQLEKFGLNPLRYYLVAGLNSFGNSSYSEKELQLKYDNDIANGYGNLLSRTLHLIDIKNIVIDESKVSIKDMIDIMVIEEISKIFESGNLRDAYNKIYLVVCGANTIITEEKPFSADCPNPEEILNNVYYILQKVSPFYQIIFPDLAEKISTALIEKKKVNLFPRLINKHEDHATKTT